MVQTNDGRKRLPYEISIFQCRSLDELAATWSNNEADIRGIIPISSPYPIIEKVLPDPVCPAVREPERQFYVTEYVHVRKKTNVRKKQGKKQQDLGEPRRCVSATVLSGLAVRAVLWRCCDCGCGCAVALKWSPPFSCRSFAHP